MPVPKRRIKIISINQRAALTVLAFVLGAWGRGCTNYSIQSGGMFFRVQHLSGVVVWAHGHNHLNEFAINKIDEHRFYTQIAGVETGHPVSLIIVRQRVFGMLIVPPLAWFALATWRNIKLRRREATGRCVTCGYLLVSNSTGICPECGTSLHFIPFSFRSDGMAAAEVLTRIAGKDRYQLNLSTTVNAAHPIESHIRQVNEAIVRWVRWRGTEGGRIVANFTTEPEQDQQILSWMLRLANQQIPEGQILKDLPIELVFSTPSGKIHNKVVLGTN
jgi:hypothetical protein